MKNIYFFEFLFLAIIMLLSITGFWKIYFGADSNPSAFHHLHVATIFTWLFLLLLQLGLIAKNNYRHHKKIGLSILFMGPLLVASTTLMSVHSAHKGLVSGEGDFLIVQNVMGTLELTLLILLAFVLRKRRKLHGALLLSTGILFMGIALFFTLISFVPAFKIEGPETFYRFATAGMTGQAICLLVGLFFLIKDFRNGWPFLLAGVFFPLNEVIRVVLSKNNGIQALTEWVGTLNPTLSFIAGFVIFLGLLASTGMLHSSTAASRVASKVN